MAERTVQASYDPANASFSYAIKDRTNLWGPFCVGCLNDWYAGNHFHMETTTHFYLHLKKCGQHYYLSELISENGSLRPFSMRKVPEELKLLDCERANCRHQKHIPTVETASIGVQTLREVAEQPSASVPAPIVVPPNPVTAPRPPSLCSISIPPPCPKSTPTPQSNGYNVKMVSNGNSSSDDYVTNRSLTKENPPHVTERRPVEFPLLFGTSYRLSCKVTEQMWIARTTMTMQIYEGMKEEFSRGLKEAFDEIGWKTTDCDVCPLIRVNEPYVEHVLSEFHRKNLYARGRWVTNGHFDMLDGFLRKQERLLRNQQKQATKTVSPPVAPVSQPTPPPRRPSRPASPLAPESLQHYPLMPSWNTRYPEEAKMSWKELTEKVENLWVLSETTNMKKLNEKYGSAVDKRENRCEWCEEDVKELSDVISHVFSGKHLKKAFDLFHITVKDMNEYANMLRGSQISKLPDKTSASPSPEPTAMSRVASTSSVASSLASSSAPVDPNAIRLPFLEGTTKPAMIMSKNSVVDFGSEVLGLLKTVPGYKSAVNAVLAKKGTCLLQCVACSKRMPAPVSVIEHVMSTAHINTIITPTRGICKAFDYAPLVSILLDAKGMTHPMITATNAESYFSMLKYSLTSLLEEEKKETPQDNIGSLFVPPSNINTVPFFEGRSNARTKMTVELVLKKNAVLRRLISNSPVLKKNLAQIMKGNGTTVSPCKLCNVKTGCLVSMLEHALSISHIEKVYNSGKTFCEIGDFLIAVQLIATAVGDKEVVKFEKAETKLTEYANLTRIKALTAPAVFTSRTVVPSATPSASTRRVITILPSASSNASSNRVVRITSKSQQDEAVTVEVENGEDKKEENREEQSLKSEETEKHMEELKATTVTFNVNEERNPEEGVNVNAVEVEMDQVGTEQPEKEQEVSRQSEGSETPVKREKIPVSAANVVKVLDGMLEKQKEEEERETQEIQSNETTSAPCIPEVEAPEEQNSTVVDSPSSSGTPPSNEKLCELFEPTAYDCVNTVRYLNKEWSENLEGIAVPENEVRLLAIRILETYGPARSLNRDIRCDTSDCSFIRQFCPEKCDLCDHQSMCICDYILHLFGNVHLKKILKDGRPVPIKHVAFWLKVLKELHPNIPFKTRFDDQLDFYVPYLEPKKFDLVPVCQIENAGYLRIMNSPSLDTTGKILTGPQLRLLGSKIFECIGGVKCLHPTKNSDLSVLFLYCPRECVLCRYKSKCICDYIIHLFDGTHIGMLIYHKIPVSTGDVQFWMEQLQYTSNGDLDLCEALGRIWDECGIKLTGYDRSVLEALTPRPGQYSCSDCEPIYNLTSYREKYFVLLHATPKTNIPTTSKKTNKKSSSPTPSRKSREDKCVVS